MPEEALHEQKNNAKDALEEAFAALILDYAAGCVSDVSEALQVIPVRLISVSEYAGSR